MLRGPFLRETSRQSFEFMITMDHFTVVCLVAWPLNEREAGVDLVFIETFLLFLCKFLLISTRTASLTQEKQESLSKRGQLQPHFHSKGARQLSTQL